MEKEVIKRIVDFLEAKEGHNAPFMWKLINNESLTEEELNIKGDLNLFKSKITSLPKGLKVGGKLSLYNSKITSLPENLKVRGSLNLSGTKITSLPEGLKVGGDLSLYETKITSLPKGLKVRGDLYVRGTELQKYSEEELREMIKPGFIKGDIIR